MIVGRNNLDGLFSGVLLNEAPLFKFGNPLVVASLLFEWFVVDLGGNFAWPRSVLHGVTLIITESTAVDFASTLAGSTMKESILTSK